MSVRFEDHSSFQNAALWSAVTGAAFGATAVAWLVTAHRWSSWACGATLALLLAAIRAGSARATGTRLPSATAVALTVVCGAAAVALGSETLPAASAALVTVAPSWMIAALSGGILGLWVAVCAAPLHVTVARDPLEAIGEDLQRQYAELANRGQSATAAVAKDSYLRAAEALSGEIEKYLRMRA
jgi:hypothetical protein